MKKLKNKEQYQAMMAHGFCNILAQELNEKLKLPLKMAIDYDYDIEDNVLVHMWNQLPNGDNYDTNGIMPTNITKYLEDNYEELDQFNIIENKKDILDLLNYWKNELPLPSKNDYLQSDNKPSEAQAYLNYHINHVKQIIIKNKNM